MDEGEMGGRPLRCSTRMETAMRDVSSSFMFVDYVLCLCVLYSEE